MDDAMREACRFYARHYEGMETLAPAKFSPEEQHALTMLAAYIRDRAGLEGKTLTNPETGERK